MGSTTEEMAAIGEANPRQCKRPRTRRLEELAAGSGENVFEYKNVLDTGRPFNTKRLYVRTCSISGSSVGINIAENFVESNFRLLQAPDEVVTALKKGDRYFSPIST